jgi:pullulanase
MAIVVRAAVCAMLAWVAPAAVAQPALADCDMAHHYRVLHADTRSHDARAFWLDGRTLRWPGKPGTGRYRLHHAARGGIVTNSGTSASGADGVLDLVTFAGDLPAQTLARFAWVGEGVTLAVPGDAPMRELHRGQLLLVQEDPQGRVLDATRVQLAGALDDLYQAAGSVPDLGATVAATRTLFRVWAPTAANVALCLYPDGAAAATTLLRAKRDERTGVWTAAGKGDLSDRYYTWLVDVFVPGTGLVRNRVTDPYALSLTTDSRRTWIGDLDRPDLKPQHWDVRPKTLAAATDMAIYELHVRDFSINDASVREAWRGKYLAFTEPESQGMAHLRALAAAGISDVHLLPVFDIATIPESGCVTPAIPQAAPDSEAQQAAVAAVKDSDCFNWGYDPFHFTAPEGSYASDPADGPVRVLEFRRMVQALHGAGLRVGMDVVYNHTTTSGQNARSVLDRIVPGYYQRYNAQGGVETSTCCDNTATENLMMAKLMIDSAVVWARDYRIDSFRFDLMGHQPRDAMLALQTAVNEAAGRHVDLLGEGWNFGEVMDGARFVQASQLSLNGTGIATFSDRARDAVRGGGCCDGGADLVRLQGWLNGMHYAPNALSHGLHSREDLKRAADMVRVGLAGSLRDYVMRDHRDRELRLEEIVYADSQPAGYVREPGEVVNYVENHDNPTLFDINVLRLPPDTSREERARVQILGLAVVAFSQGIAYFHAGGEILRSKSLDRNSYDSGDWFNRIDWTLEDNYFGTGLPPAWDNGPNWPWMRPLLANPTIKPERSQIVWTRDAFLDLLRIRASSTVFRLRTAEDVRARLSLPNSGAQQEPTVLVGHLDGEGYVGANFREVMYFINVDVRGHALHVEGQGGRDWVLHPVHRADGAADRRAAGYARYDAASGTFEVPARSAVVFVRPL